jgi:hypothetical protein
MFTLFRSSGLLALVLAHNSSSVFVSASNEGADRFSIIDYFQEPSSYEQFFSVVTPRLRMNEDSEGYTKCRPAFKTTRLSIAAARELKIIKLEEMKTSIVDFDKAPTFLAETDEDCVSKGGETFYFTAESTCMREVYPKFKSVFDDYLIDMPVCFVGTCSPGKIEHSVRSFSDCPDAKVTNEAPNAYYNPDEDTCLYYEFSGNFSRKALKELYYVKEEAIREGVANALHAPTTLGEIQEDCDEQGGVTHFITSTLGCLDNFDDTGYFSPDPEDPSSHGKVVVEDFPICLVGTCPDDYVEDYVQSSFSQCDYAKVTDDIEDKLYHTAATE